jgi:hypothetical protein
MATERRMENTFRDVRMVWRLLSKAVGLGLTYHGQNNGIIIPSHLPSPDPFHASGDYEEACGEDHD